MFCAIFSNGRWPPSCSSKLQKKSKWLNAKIIVTQSWYNSIERSFQFYTMLLLVRSVILRGLFLFNFETTQCKNHFDTTFKIHKVVIEILSFSCSGLFSAKASGCNLGITNSNNSKQLHTRHILTQSWINFNQWFFRYRHFHVYILFLVTAHGCHLQRSIFIKF